MPAVSGKQYRAMRAAAAGHSTIGIPQSVGKDFVAYGPPKGPKGGGSSSKKKIEGELRSKRLHGLQRRMR